MTLVVPGVLQGDSERDSSVVAKFILTGSELDPESEKEAAQFGDVLFTDDQLYGYRSIVHKTYFVLTHVVCCSPSCWQGRRRIHWMDCKAVRVLDIGTLCFQ